MLPPSAAPIEAARQPKPDLRLERQRGAAPRWCWVIHREGNTLMRSDVVFQGTEAAWEAGRAALVRLESRPLRRPAPVSFTREASSERQNEKRNEKRGLTLRTQVYLSADLAVAVEVWRAAQPNKPTRADAVRQLASLGLEVAARSEEASLPVSGQTTPGGVRTEVAMTAEMASAVVGWQRAEADQPTRHEAIRRLLKLGLEAVAEPRI